MRCYCGPGDEESLAKLVAAGELTQGDADAVARFRDFLVSINPDAKVTEVAELARRVTDDG